MRRIILAVSAVGAISAAGSSPASAAYEYPYCMQSRTMGTQCYYTSYNQCMASANGLGAECIVNPIVAFAWGVISLGLAWKERVWSRFAAPGCFIRVGQLAAAGPTSAL